MSSGFHRNLCSGFDGGAVGEWDTAVLNVTYSYKLLGRFLDQVK